MKGSSGNPFRMVLRIAMQEAGSVRSAYAVKMQYEATGECKDEDRIHVLTVAAGKAQAGSLRLSQ
jgi:hypothetical protein